MIDDDTRAHVRRDTTVDLPDAILDLIEAARIAEETASGSDRRRAYRDTRVILGALREAGYSVRELAEVMAASTNTVRTRIFTRGMLSEESVLALTPLTADDLAGLNVQQQTSDPVIGFCSRHYAAVDILRLIAATP